MTKSKNLIAAINDLQVLAKSRSSITRRNANFYLNLWAAKTTLTAAMAAKLTDLKANDAARTAKSTEAKTKKLVTVIQQAQQTIQTLQSPEFIEMAEVANNHVSILWGKFDCVSIAKNTAELLTETIAKTTYQNIKSLITEINNADFWTFGKIKNLYREVRRAEFIETGAVMVITFQKANGEIAQRYGTTARTAKDYFRTVSGKPFQGNIPNGNKINYIEFNVESGQCDGFKSFIVENFIDARPLNSLEADFINKTFAPYFAQRQKNSVETLELFAKNDY